MCFGHPLQNGPTPDKHVAIWASREADISSLAIGDAQHVTQLGHFAHSAPVGGEASSCDTVTGQLQNNASHLWAIPMSVSKDGRPFFPFLFFLFFWVKFEVILKIQSGLRRTADTQLKQIHGSVHPPVLPSLSAYTSTQSNTTQSSHQTAPTCLVPELDVFDANSHQLSGIKGVPLDNKDLVLMPSKPTHAQKFKL